MTAQPFRIDVSQEVLDDLQSRLARTRWTDEVEGAGWDYGTNLGYLKALTDYWQETFDWRAQETMLNGFAQFRAEIDGFGIHFIHERGKGPNPMPLLLLHGWPDSFYRFYKIIPMLTDPARFGGDPAMSFDVIVPSLPGFGFSDKARNRGGADSAALFHKLMTDTLGYTRYAAQGGDTGTGVAQGLATRYPESIIGIHLTDIGWDMASIDPATYSPAEKAFMEKVEKWSFEEGAYISIQGTKPQTLAYGLNDSPAGLAAWIMENFRKFTDPEGEIEQHFTKDELLTNIMIYWVTQTINSSFRWYYEGMHADWGGSTSDGAEWDESANEDASAAASEEAQGGWGARSETPVGLALFPKDNPPPREMAERTLNVQHWTEMPRGGHFAALENPELLAEDLRAFFDTLR